MWKPQYNAENFKQIQQFLFFQVLIFMCVSVKFCDRVKVRPPQLKI